MIINNSSVVRNTVQRSVILDILRSRRDHPTAEVVYSVAKKKIPTITLATVYRNLNKLYSEGLINRFKIDGTYHFDAFMGHAHAICLSCNNIIDVEVSSLKSLSKKAVPGFSVRDVELIYYGLCDNCLTEVDKNGKDWRKG